MDTHPICLYCSKIPDQKSTLLGGFVMLDPSVRRLRRPVAGRLNSGAGLLRSGWTNLIVAVPVGGVCVALVEEGGVRRIRGGFVMVDPSVRRLRVRLPVGGSFWHWVSDTQCQFELLPRLAGEMKKGGDGFDGVAVL